MSGEPINKGARTPLRAIMELWRQGIAPEAVPGRLPHLTVALVFDALGYYSSHQAEINVYIERNTISEDCWTL